MLKTTAKLLTWIDTRFPLTEIWRKHAADYFVPKNLNFWYSFGVFSLLVLVNQLVTGIWLTMHYTPTADAAFSSVQHIMREVRYGWLIRYLHSTGASAFFIVIYLHMYRGLIYGSYQKPRELVWLLGMMLYLLLMMEAFTGYVLPWGQMSYWAAKVIINLFNAIPIIGKQLAIWIQGDYTLSGETLHRFFAYHVAILSMLMVGLAVFHIMALHQVGSNNPKGVDIKKKLNAKGKPLDGITFHPYYTVKDLFAVVIFLIVFAVVVFFAPTMHGYFLEHDNFAPANPLTTPLHIAPVWYLAPFYAILRAIPNKLFGIMTMGAAVAILFILPWLDRSKVKSLRYKGICSKIAIVTLIISFAGLGFIGTQSPTPILTWFARLFTVGYFSFFILMPFYTRLEKTLTPPSRL